MKILNLIQGTQEWLNARLEHFTASEAPAVMGESKYMTRSQLLDLKKGWQSNPVSSFTQKLFDDGHEHEDMAREILELEELEDFPPIVGSLVIDDLELLASFDGYGESGAWEHKDWNKTLAENVRNNILEPHYYWQLEHQCIVGELDEVKFTCSDGTEENRVSMVYQSAPERREQLIAAWKQFAIDLESHELTAKVEKVVAEEVIALPAIQYQMNGLAINSNLDAFKEAADKMVSDAQLPIESDQDFANAEQRVKQFKKAEDKIKEVSQAVLGEVESIDKFTKDLSYIGEQLRQARLDTDKKVKSRKAEIRQEVLTASLNEINSLVNKANSELRVAIQLDASSIEQSMKGKKTVDSLKDAAATALAALKIELNEQASTVRTNAELMKKPEYNEFKFLFSDWSQVAFKANDDFEALVKSRIADHKEAESKRLEEQRIRMEAEAKAKAEREAQAKAEQERERIRKEEYAKAKAEQEDKRKEEQAKRNLAEKADRVECEKKEDAKREQYLAAKAMRAQVDIDIADSSPLEQKAPSEVVSSSPLAEKFARPDCTTGSIETAVHQEEMISITLAEFNTLIDRSNKLDALECAGVDNWDGYDYAMELMAENA